MATFPDSDFPAALDTDIPVPADGGTITSDWGKGVRNAILATQTELGTDPSGSEATVAARLAAIEAENTAQGVDLAAVEADLAPLSDRVFSVDSFGAVGDGSTDDTAAFLAARDALVTAGGGTLLLGAKTYLLDGSLLTNRNGYALLPLPTGATPITIRGVQPANQCDPRTDEGRYSIIKVTKTGLSRSGTYGVPSVIGGPTDSTWAENMVSLRDFCLWLPANPTIAGIDLWHVRRCLVDGVSVQAFNTGDSDYTNPTSVYAFGIRTPDPLNYNAVLIRSAQVHGTYAGLVGSVESLNVAYFVAKWCKVGWGVQAGGHGGNVSRMSLEWCPYSVSGWSETAGATSIPTGPNGETQAQVSVSYLAVEDYGGTSKWYDPVTNVNDSTNRIKGVAFFDKYVLGTGVASTLSKSGGTGLTTVSLQSPDFGAGSGTPPATKRDRLTAAAGNDTLTLGETPIDDSLLVWVNNVIKWPGVDYTRAGAVVTFTAPLSASQVVLSAYQTTNPSAGAAALSTAAVTPSYPDAVAALSPLAYWKQDELIGATTLTDSSGNSRTMTLGAGLAPQQASLLADGTGYSALFNGSAYGAIASAAWMNTNYVSMVMRYQPRSGDLTGVKVFLSRWLNQGGSQYSYFMHLNDGKAKMELKANGTAASAVTGATTLVAGTTYTLGFTYDGSTAKVYVNGVLDASVSYAGVLDNTGTGSALEIARVAGAAFYGGGYYDEMALFGTALTAAQMEDLHDSALTT